MSNYLTENLRTVALVGHGSCGKTSLIEAMLYRTGMISELGSIERGNTMCDNDALEKQVQHSIRLAVAHVDTALPDLTPVRIHVLDTPGYPDYIGQDMSALDAVKSVCAVIDATKGVELLTRRMMDIAKERGLCRMIVINKFDAPDVDLEQLLLDLQEVWGPPTTAPSSSTASTRTKEKPTFSASVKSIAPSLKRSSSRTTKCSSTISRKAASTLAPCTRSSRRPCVKARSSPSASSPRRT